MSHTQEPMDGARAGRHDPVDPTSLEALSDDDRSLLDFERE